MSNIPNPYSTFRFWVELKGITEGAFTECSGLDSEIEVEEWKEGGLNTRVHQFPGRVKTATNLVLKRGIATAELWDWYYGVVQGKLTRGEITRQNLSVILYGYDEMPVIRWNITGALPIKWVGPSFKSDSRDVAVESIELIHQGFERK